MELIYNTVKADIQNEFSTFQDVTESLNKTGNTRNHALFGSITSLIFAGAIWILISNFFIICAPFLYKPLRRKVYQFLSSLAFSDFFKALVAPVACFMYYSDSNSDTLDWNVEYEISCCLRMTLILIPSLASVFHYLLIALDRYIAIVHRERYFIYMNDS